MRIIRNQRPTSPLNCFCLCCQHNFHPTYQKIMWFFTRETCLTMLHLWLKEEPLVAKVATLVISSTTMMNKDSFSKEYAQPLNSLLPQNITPTPPPFNTHTIFFLSELLHMYGYFMTRNKVITAETTTLIDIAIFWLFGTSIR